jgi:hypothetical protein
MISNDPRHNPKPGHLSILEKEDDDHTRYNYYHIDPLSLIQSSNLSPELENLNLEIKTGSQGSIELRMIWASLEYFLEKDHGVIFRHLKLFHFETGYLLRSVIFRGLSTMGKINKNYPPAPKPFDFRDQNYRSQVINFCRIAHQQGFLLIDRYIRNYQEPFYQTLFGLNIIHDLHYEAYWLLDELDYITPKMTEIMRIYFDDQDSRPISQELLKFMYKKDLITQEDIYNYFGSFDVEPKISIEEFIYAGIPLDQKLFEIFLGLFPKYHKNSNVKQEEITNVINLFTEHIGCQIPESDTPRLYEI